jgi:hypothetical protein
MKMKRRKFKLNNIVLLTVFCFIMNDIKSQCDKRIKYVDSLCLDYVINFKPLYYAEGDSLVVAKLPSPSVELIFLLDSLTIKEDFSYLKYTYVIIVKLSEEHSKVNNTSYLINDEVKENPFINMLMVFMSKSAEVEGEFFYYELSNWMYTARKTIKGLKKAKRQFL